MRLFAPVLADFWHYRELLWQFTLRNVELRHKGSHLGLIWSFLNPLLILGLYVFVFRYIFGGHFGIIPNETTMDYALGILLGLTFYHFVAEILGVSPTIVVANPNFVKKVVFPLEVLPAAAVGSAAFHMLISFLLVLVGVAFLGPGLHFGVLWLPVLILPVVLFCLGTAWFFSALGVFFRDTGQIMQFLSLALMFGSAVFYSGTKVATAGWMVLRFNPLLLVIELSRNAVMWQRALNLRHLGYVYFVSLAACMLGYLAFQKMKPAFADVL